MRPFERTDALADNGRGRCAAMSRRSKQNRRGEQMTGWIRLCLLSMLALFFLAGCATSSGVQTDSPLLDTGSGEAIQIQDLDITSGQTIFVPAYSEIYYASDNRTVDLAVTLTVHNTDFENPIVLTSVRYYSTQGQLLKEYLTQPVSLGPLASTDFFVDAGEQAGGVGTNFIVEWVAEQPVYEPVVEALMLTTSGTQGLSFTSPGRVISQIK